MATAFLELTGKRSLRLRLAEMLDHRDLLVLLVRKDLKVKYKATALGFFWSLLNPLLLMVIYAVVYSFLFRFTIPRYPIFLLAGLLPWNAFLGALNAAGLSIIANGNLIRRVRFPIEFLPLSSVLSGLVNLLLSLVILVIFSLVYGQPLGLPLLALPVLLVLQLVFTVGLGLALASLTVYFRDLEYLVGILLTVLFFATPVIYPLSLFEGKRTIHVWLELNPITWLVVSYQHIWHENTWPEPLHVMGLTVVALVALIGGWAIFRRVERRFAEEV